ncbi:MAG: hypothetical protein MUW56_10750 [Chryseobacterium sp.]|uniref:hypothetical protein n=1 Tax=Chryseobacterium sp. TaxID=1871047 RepID=UPI0025C61D53|nr:hypothetical protein [Chryseobacterium sp.]MCJ7934090.1 hypothetical protein [Chryseobacterium sp.]
MTVAELEQIIHTPGKREIVVYKGKDVRKELDRSASERKILYEKYQTIYIIYSNLFCIQYVQKKIKENSLLGTGSKQKVN